MDVVISTSCLLNLVEMHDDPSVSSYIPLMVKQDGESKMIMKKNVFTSSDVIDSKNCIL
jgi:hypothetical protein